MEALFEVLKYTLPSLVVFATAYFLIKSHLEAEERKRVLEYKSKNQNLITPIRLQAYERLSLFLERISPNSLIFRVQIPNMKAADLQKELLGLIRVEFEHNLSQQIYITKEAWQVIKSAKEQVIKIINSSADKVDANAPALLLSKTILENTIKAGASPTDIAIEFIKKEASTFF